MERMWTGARWAERSATKASSVPLATRAAREISHSLDLFRDAALATLAA